MSRLVLSMIVALGVSAVNASEDIEAPLTSAMELIEQHDLDFLNDADVEDEAFQLELEESDAAAFGPGGFGPRGPRGRFGRRGPGRRGPIGRPGRGGSLKRAFVCVAESRRGEVFRARGPHPQIARRRAMMRCRNGSVANRPRCYVVGCRLRIGGFGIPL